MSRIDEIRAREQAATPGPWKLDAGYLGGINYVYCNGGSISETIRKRPNADFIAHSREDIPFLLDENARLTAKVEQLEAACDEWESFAAEEQLDGIAMMLECADWKAKAEALEAELAGYQEAEQDGRLVVLPCKVGDTVYCESHIRGRVKSFEAPDISWIVEHISNFGKTVFLTRKEAEAALQRDKTELEEKSC